MESQVYCGRTKEGRGGAARAKEMAGSILNFMLQILPNCRIWDEGGSERGEREMPRQTEVDSKKEKDIEILAL